MAAARTALEAILLDRSWISAQELKRARHYRQPGQSLTGALIELRVIESRLLARALAEVYRLPFQAHLDDHAADAHWLARLGIEYARRNRLLPLGTDGVNAVAAAADPSRYEPLDDLGVFFGMPVQTIVVPFDVLDRATERTNGASAAPGAIVNVEERNLEAAAARLDMVPEPLFLDAEAPPIVGLVKALLWKAVDARATDIRIEPSEHEMLVRLRSEGSFYNVMSSPKCYESALTSCLKLMAHLDVADRRIAQTGHIRLRVAGRIMVSRISTAPASHGEQILLHLPDGAQERAGIIDDCIDALRELAVRPAGPAFCVRCGELIVVASALFCKDCGARLADNHRLAVVR